MTIEHWKDEMRQSEYEFDKEYFINLLEDMRRQLSHSKATFAVSIGISVGTYDRLLDMSNPRKITFKTQRLIKNYINNYSNLRGTDDRANTDNK